MSLGMINDYIEKYQDILEEIDELYASDVTLPLMYMYNEPLSENNYYGYDFSKTKNIHKLFYNGSSDFFSGLFVPDNVHNVKPDQCPIYIFDLSCGTDASNCELVGNFKTYMEQIFNSIPQKSKRSYKKALKDLKVFSDHLENYEYQLTINQ